jgi:MEDS: MEthanogen/methylotroph, DcmR Sensory domain
LKDPQAFVFLEAESMLREFMVEGMPDAARFNAAVTPLLDRLSRRRTCTVRAYGEMVDVLWKRGNTAAAIRLEALWNTLADTQPFSLLCGYAADNVYENSAVEDICRQHSHVISGSSGVVA